MIIIQLTVTSWVFRNFPGQLDGYEDMWAQVATAECCIEWNHYIYSKIWPHIVHIPAVDTCMGKAEPV